MLLLHWGEEFIANFGKLRRDEWILVLGSDVF
jgi:hypothetical protein